MHYRITEKHISFREKKEARNRDREFFNWVLLYYRVNGKMPTLSEMARTYHFTKERARQIMERLVKDGYLFKNKKQGWRTTYILNPFFMDKGRTKIKK